MTLRRRLCCLSTVALVIAVSARCSSSSSGGNRQPTAVSGAFPVSLAVASPFEIYGGAAYVSKVSSISALLTAPNILKCRPSLNLSVSYPDSACFGPALTYTNHPQNATVGPPEDIGILTGLDSANNACFAAQFNSRLSGLALLTDTAENALAAMLCVARVDGHPLPGVGQTVDMKSELSELFSISASLPQVVTATIARGADTADHLANYTSMLSLKHATQTIAIRLRHIPMATDNTKHRGKLSVSISESSPSSGLAGLCGTGAAAGTGVTDVVSVNYEQSTSHQLKLQIAGGHYCGAAATPYVSTTNFTVDPTQVYPTSVTGWSQNFTTAVFNRTLDDGGGSYYFAWQNTAIDGHMRAMNTTLSSSSSTLSGCGYYGFGADASAGVSSATASTFICNWASFAGLAVPDHTGTPKVQRQCVSQVGGQFASDAARLAITYAPVNTCDVAAPTFSMVPTAGGTAVSGPITNNLFSIAAITDLTAPTLPVDVDVTD